jgi:hypothetical protein
MDIGGDGNFWFGEAFFMLWRAPDTFLKSRAGGG